MESVKTRVARGVKWLDKNKPGWESKVVVKRLDLADSCQCVLGQLFEKDAIKRYGYSPWWSGQPRVDGYEYATTEVARVPDDARRDFWAERRGFDALHNYDSDQIIDFAALQTEWERVIKERRKAKRQAA